jgi:acetyl-CoA carboxylase, biotin carboxylase subunit
VLESVLVANRGEIARRIIATARRLGVRAVAAYSEADADLPYVREADEAVLIGPAPPAQSYLDAGAILAAARQSGAAAIHPGYGFLSENAAFAHQVMAEGLIWVGPTPQAIELMGDKINARNLMERAGVPVALGSADPVTSASEALAEAERIGYPVMVKAAAGGGGIGMSAAAGPEALQTAFETARTRAERFFGSPAILLERFVERARHVEVQIMGLTDGRVVTLGERDCSVQRRHQKVAEETPSPGVSPQLREGLLVAAVRAGETVGYRGAGTVEFLLDVRKQEFVFLEMNTRLQVEHPVTELVTGIDLVEQQFLVAAGEPVSFEPAGVRPEGHALEFRVYAEDPVRFLPSPGAITQWEEPAGPGIRVDAGYEAGNKVTPFYDPLLAKLCAWGPTRAEALGRAREAVAAFRLAGPKTNLPFHADLLASEAFVSGDYDTSVVAGLRP